ncbi:retrovirus-related pol polyprotein from transposon TNT 1-94 [Tanacetum coccineum]
MILHHLMWISSTGALGNLDAHDISDCSGCKLAKFSALPFSNSVSSSNAPFDLVHSDVWGPSPVSTKGVFKDFRALVKTQHSTVIECFRYDLGAGYTSNDFVGLLKSDGTIYQTSCIDTPQQNGVAERKHRHLGEPVLTSTYVINKIPTAHNSSLSPFEKLYETLLDYSSLRVFGYFVLKPHVERTKLSPKSTLCVFLGCGESQKGYRCYDSIGQKLDTSRHVDFLEHIPYYSIPTSSHNLTQFELMKIDPFEEPTPLVSFASFVASIHSLHEPKSYTEAVYDPLWQGAMAEELVALHQTHIYNARLVAKGYSQEYGMDYEETFSLVAKMTTIWTLIAVASSCQWKISHMDVKNVFLYGDLNEEVYMTQTGTTCLVASSPKGYLLSQSKYIGDLLDRARITDELVEDIHIDAKAKYTPTNGDPLHDPSLYRTIVGSLVYLTVTPPDISYVVHLENSYIFSWKSMKQDVLSRSSTDALSIVSARTTSEIVLVSLVT